MRVSLKEFSYNHMKDYPFEIQPRCVEVLEVNVSLCPLARRGRSECRAGTTRTAMGDERALATGTRSRVESRPRDRQSQAPKRTTSTHTSAVVEPRGDLVGELRSQHRNTSKIRFVLGANIQTQTLQTRSTDDRRTCLLLIRTGKYIARLGKQTGTCYCCSTAECAYIF